MQQTDTYKLNLIESSDKFSPDPLNENAQKLEAALSAETETRSGQTAGLEQRVVTLEGHKIAVGYYDGNGGTITIDLPFTPLAVIIGSIGILGAGIAVMGHPALGITLHENGFTAVYTVQGVNSKNNSYDYCAIS